MSDSKYNFGHPAKMPGLSAGEKATFRFLDLPEKIDTEWGVKYIVSIHLLSHPAYPSLSSSKGIDMKWQTGASVMVKDIVPLLQEGNKEFLKDYKDLTWQLESMEDGSLRLTNA